MILLGLFLSGIGTLFVAYLWDSHQRAAKMDAWVATPCTIQSATIDDSQLTQHHAPKYRLDVRYTYEFAGKSHTGTRVKRLPVEKANRKKLVALQEQYPAGSNTTCYVNPEDPAFAVLEKDSKAALYSIWFPGLFVVGGLGIAVSAFLPDQRKKVRSGQD